MHFLKKNNFNFDSSYIEDCSSRSDLQETIIVLSHGLAQVTRHYRNPWCPALRDIYVMDPVRTIYVGINYNKPLNEPADT